MEKKIYCQQCNENVLTYSVMRDGIEEVCCLYCGLPIARQEQKKESKPDKEVENHKENQKLSEQVVTSTEKIVLYADDSTFMRELLKDIFVNNNITQNFKALENGELIIEEYTRALRNSKKIDLIILDIKMPYISGISVGIAIRAIERAFGFKPTPILFFSVRQADEELQKFFLHASPAYYLNKGASSDIEDLEKRLLFAIQAIFKH